MLTAKLEQKVQFDEEVYFLFTSMLSSGDPDEAKVPVRVSRFFQKPTRKKSVWKIALEKFTWKHRVMISAGLGSFFTRWNVKF